MNTNGYTNGAARRGQPLTPARRRETVEVAIHDVRAGDLLVDDDGEVWEVLEAYPAAYGGVTLETYPIREGIRRGFVRLYCPSFVTQQKVVRS